jgi:quercetin dioxygenase-like cupin family protein
MKKLILCAAAAASTIGLAYAADTPPPVRRIELQSSPVPDGKYVAKLMRVEFDPGAKLGLHTHPGDEIGYALTGQMTLSIQGHPERILKPGDSYVVKAGTPHAVQNSGSQVFTGVATFVVESDKPLSTPVK